MNSYLSIPLITYSTFMRWSCTVRYRSKVFHLRDAWGNAVSLSKSSSASCVLSWRIHRTCKESLVLLPEPKLLPVHSLFVLISCRQYICSYPHIASQKAKIGNVSKMAVTFGGGGGALLSAITRMFRKLTSLSGSRNFRGRGVDGTFATLQ